MEFTHDIDFNTFWLVEDHIHIAIHFESGNMFYVEVDDIEINLLSDTPDHMYFIVDSKFVSLRAIVDEADRVYPIYVKSAKEEDRNERETVAGLMAQDNFI